MIVTYQIITGRNDARENDAGVMGINFSDLLFGNIRRWQFMRLINIEIPQGATINSAYLKLYSFSSGYTSGNLTIAIYAEKSVNGLILTSAHGATTSEISGRARTTQTINWINPAFTAPSTQYASPDIKAIIQEIINQPAWQKGNAINIITDCGAAAAGWRDTWAFDGNPSKSAVLEIDYTDPITKGLAEQGKMKQKDFIYKIYDKDGVYLGKTWANEVANIPEFIWTMNGGMGEINIQLKRSLKDFGENVDVAFGNIVKCYIQDGDQERGYKIWEGKINRYEPSVSSEGEEIVNVVATSRLLEMERRLIKLVNDTEVPYASKDPSAILKSLIDMPSAGGIILKGKINDTSTTASYTFQANTIREGFDIIVKLSPQYWYWWLNADNEINFKITNYDEIDHQLYIGKEVSNVRMTKSVENLCNRVYFMGGLVAGANLYHMYERTSSQSEWGIREILMKDERVTVDATAELLATSYLNNYDHPISEIEIEVVDSNIDPINGYDIERFKPGDIVRVLHPEMEKRDTLWDEAYWDVDYWDYDIKYALGQPHQILEINYQFNKCVLKLSQKLEDFQKRMEEINRNLEETAKINLPSIPT